MNKQIYYLNKTWCMLSMKWNRSTRDTIRIVKLKDGTFQTFSFTIQWNVLEYHINLLAFFSTNPSLSFY